MRQGMLTKPEQGGLEQYDPIDHKRDELDLKPVMVSGDAIREDEEPAMS